MQRNELCPLDGRYKALVEEIANVCSERALVKNRIEVELRYLNKLVNTLGLVGSDWMNETLFVKYYGRGEETEQLIERVFELEKTTRHDVKAVEMALQEEFEKIGISEFIPWIHFALTSQDINSVAVWMQVRAARAIVEKGFEMIMEDLYTMSQPIMGLAMLSRTHGQPATPTTMGKELMVYYERLGNALKVLRCVTIRTKFGGATGGFNAHHLVYPMVDWPRWADVFLREAFGMERQQYTTQIDHYDEMAEVFDAVKRCNVILVDLCRDMWQYISMKYFRQVKPTGAIGSSTMPHKTNPINFENAEGNFGYGNVLFEHMAVKLPVSRMQRDLTDSTVTRNIGVAFGHTQVGICKVLEGLKTITVASDVITKDLESHVEVITEGIQTILRAAGVSDAYDRVKRIVTSSSLEMEELIKVFVADLLAQKLITHHVALKILQLTPRTYEAVMPQ